MTKAAQLAPELPDDTGDAVRWVTDDELASLCGVPRDTLRTALAMYDADPKSGFPKREKIYGNRRFYPAIKDYWNEVYRPKIRLLRSMPNDR